MSRKGGPIIHAKGQIIRRIRTCLIDVFGEDPSTLTRKHFALTQAIALKKFGTTISSKTAAGKWLKQMTISGAFSDWPTLTKFETDKKGVVPKVTPQKIKPNLSEKYVQYINESLKWIKISDTIMERDGHRCVQCRRNGNLNVHHLTYEHLYHEEKYPADLVTLCRHCHDELHSSIDKSKLNKDLGNKVSKILTEISLTFTDAELKIAKQRIATIKARKEAAASPSSGQTKRQRRYDNEILNQIYTGIRDCFETRRNTGGKFKVDAFTIEATQIAMAQIVSLLTDIQGKKSISSVRGVVEQYIGEFKQEIKLKE
jgi:hypothetical protein